MTQPEASKPESAAVEISSCPFCGKEGLLRQIKNDGRWIVDCNTVVCIRPTTGPMRSREKAIAAWNRRVPTAPTTAVEPVAWMYTIPGANVQRVYASRHLYNDGWPETPLIPATALTALTEQVERLEEALRVAVAWHEDQDKAISKQPNANAGDNGWRRHQHQEQIDEMRAALKGSSHG